MSRVLMRVLLLFLLCATRVAYSAKFTKEDLRRLPEANRLAKLSKDVSEVMDNVYYSATVGKTTYSRNICDGDCFMCTGFLTNFSDEEILDMLKLSLVDSELSITRSLCNNCPKTNAWDKEPNCRTLVINW